MEQKYPETLGVESAKNLARLMELFAEASRLLLDPNLASFLELVQGRDWSGANLMTCLVKKHLSNMEC